MDLVEKSATIPSAKETGLDRAYCAHPWEEAGVSEPQLSWPQSPLLYSRLCPILGRRKEDEPPAPGGDTGTRGQPLLGTPGGMMFMPYMVRGPGATLRCWLLEVGVSRALSHGW